jgi:hypothetical protein
MDASDINHGGAFTPDDEPDASFYDLEAVYDEQVAPLMAQIIAVCKEHNLPMVASFAYACLEERTSFCTTVLLEDEERVPDKYLEVRRVLLRGTEY